jgi:hypothetical protein
MKTWEVDVELRVRKTLIIQGPNEEAARRFATLLSPVLGQPATTPFVKWTDGGPPRKTKKPKLVTLAEARTRLSTELDRLIVMGPILSSNVELRIDGQPRSGLPPPRDPGVALYFQLNGRPIVLACDSFTDVAQNIAAIAAHIDAMRRMERYGVATTDQMFTGFLALPAPMVVDDWREALGNPVTLAEAESNYRYSMRGAHPDAPAGSHEAASKLNAAITRAREVLK